ncbi:MAG: putative ABC transporter permease [Lachnospiraceae bacterium]|nr:putative ABC transporter permease [Lachnospiraceae bacterium]
MENNELSFYVWIMIIIVCSFIGFVVENLWLTFRYGFMDNRNMNLPFLLGYGLAILFIYHVIGTPENKPDFKYFISVFLIVSLGEILLGHLVEEICGIYYWDYSSLPLHLTRYTDFFTSTGFALLITKFMRNVFPVIVDIINAIDSGFLHLLAMFGITALIIDYLISFTYMYKNRDFYRKWRFETGLDISSKLFK